MSTIHILPCTVALSLAAFPALFAASNPEVVPIECSEPEEVYVCDGVDGPTAGSVEVSSDCTNFTFRLRDVTGGVERNILQEVYTGGVSCPEAKVLGGTETQLPPIVSWTADGGEASFGGSGSAAFVPRGQGVCSVTCRFEVAVAPTLCDPPPPEIRTAVAVFVDEVNLDGPGSRMCCVSTNHSPHLMTMSACECVVLEIEPGVASVVEQDCTNAVILGGSAYEGAYAVGTAPCGIASNSFDVVTIGALAATGLCGCRSASDASDEDSDAPTVETMDMGPDETGFSLTLGVAPEKWACDALWASGGMPDRGSFADGEQTTYISSSGEVRLDAWFDCESDGVRTDDEPKRRVIGVFACLGSLECVREQEDEGGHRADGRCDESFGPGDSVRIRNTGFLPTDREHALSVLKTMPLDKTKPMNVETANITPSGSLNEWNLAIPEDCADGLVWLELTDPMHSCTSLVVRLQVQACPCTTCEDFAKTVEENGCVDVTFGLGRTSSGGAKAPVRFVLERTDALPDISSEAAPDGRMDVTTANGVMTVAFTRAGEQVPVAVYALTPGADAFTMRETRDGLLRRTTVWTLADGTWTMEVFDETVAPRELVRRDVRTSRATARGAVHTLARGGESVETETEEIDGIGLVAVRETRGVGADARTTWKSHYASGAAKGRVRSELFPDGSWTMYTYDATGRVETVVSPFGDSPPVLDDRNVVIGYNGAVRRTTYNYAPVDVRDGGTTLADEPRAVVESVGSDAAGWTEVSRRYAAHFVADGVRIEVAERAASPGAAYGAEGSQRTVSSYLWNCRGAGRPVRRETPDGLVKTWGYDFTPSNVVVETMAVPASATNGVPFRTTVERTVEDLRGDVLREETYVVTDSDRELLSWTDFERDAAGHELRRESSDGSLVERAWSCCGPEWEMDERGIVTVYSYDALGRQSTMTRNGVTTLWNYDLAGNATNVTRFADALVASSSTGYDSAGRLAWNVGEDGVRTEYAYSTSPDGGEVRTTIRAANTDCAMTNTVVSFRDGSTKASYLNGILKSTELHEPFASTTYEGTNGLASARWSRSETDFLGRSISESRPGYGGSTLVTSNFYDSAGRLVSTISLSARSTRSTRLNSRLYLYDGLNERIATVSDRNFNNSIDWTGPDLVSSNSTHYVKLGGDWWRETKSYSIHDDNSAVARLMGVRRSRVTGLGANGLDSETISINQRGNATTNRVFRNRASAEEIAWVKYPTSTTPAVTTSTNGLVRSSVSQTGVTTTFAYDAFRREVSQTNGRGNTTRIVYDSLGRVSSTIDALGYATAYGYDAFGRRISVTDPLTNTVYTAYDSEGHVVSQRGATYPVDYSYDEFGEKVSMTTYRDINAAGDVTRWLRDEATGLVTNKVYADGKGPRYDYTPDGKLATRTWARGIVTTYSYDDNGSLTNTVYSDGTPTISLAYNRAGLQTRAEDAAGVTTFLYDDFGSLTNETVIGVAGTNTIERFYDTFGRNAGYALNGIRQSALAYDPATGRLAMMQIPSGQSNNPSNQTIKQFTWTYLDGSDLKSSLSYPNGLTASWQYDANGQLLQVRNATPTNTISQYDYIYDAARRRVNVFRSGTAFDHADTFSYGYNEKSELTNAVAAVDSDYRYAYDFDDIGNRESSSERGTNSVYAANNLNQYTAITDVAATPSSSQTFQPQFDDDGNQTLIKTATGIWSVTYNGENRPILWTSTQQPVNPSIGQSVNQTISMSYDRMGRRVTKNAQHFVYDGYLQVANFEYLTSDIKHQTFIWDPTEPVATRPLVWNSSTFQPFNFSTSYYTHDGNKNVSEVIRSDGMSDAHYEYAPFGMLTSMVGEFAFQNQWRFSSESSDDTLALLHYNYRDYSSALGCFLSRDHEIFQATNPYVFTKNSCINGVDVLGLEERTSFEDYMKLLASKNGYNDAEYDMDYIEFALAHGCVGVVWANIGYNPLKDIGRQELQAYNKCFSTRARAVKEKTKFKDSNHCCKLEKGSTPRLYSIHFRNSKGQDGVNPKAKQPDSDGFVDLSNWRKKSRNFDFAFEDDNGRMVGASQFYDPDHSKFGESEDSSDSMIITRTQKEWSAEISTSVINGIDLEMQYDTEVWCVACSQLSNFKKQTN